MWALGRKWAPAPSAGGAPLRTSPQAGGDHLTSLPDKPTELFGWEVARLGRWLYLVDLPSWVGGWHRLLKAAVICKVYRSSLSLPPSPMGTGT